MIKREVMEYILPIMVKPMMESAGDWWETYRPQRITWKLAEELEREG